MLQLIKYFSQNIYKCIIFESKIITLIERLQRIYAQKNEKPEVPKLKKLKS